MLLSLLAYVSDPALAYKLTGFAWSSADDCAELDEEGNEVEGDDGRLRRCWSMDDDVEDSLPEGYPLEVLQKSWDNWEEAAQCAAIANQYTGTSDLGEPDYDGGQKIYWDDPAGELGVGVLGVSYSAPDGASVTWNGQRYYHIGDGDIVFAANVDWATTEEVEAGDCQSGFIESTATHEIGHSWGMGHSCDDGESCTDPLAQEATMFWQRSGCNTDEASPNADDVAGITSIYGPSIVISGGGLAGDVVGTDRTGAVPFEACFSVDINDDTVRVLSQHWEFGDGESADWVVADGEDDPDNNPCHTYTSVGQFSVTATIVIESDVCDAQTVSTTSLGYIVACDPPAPEEGAGGFFEMKEIDGLDWQTINYTDVSTYGCVDTIVWEAYKGTSSADISDANRVDFNGTDVEGGESLGAWAPQINFPEAGSYVVVMNVGGPAGLQAGSLVVEVSDSGGGCSTAPGAAGGFVAGLSGLALLSRRRRITGV